MFRGDCYEGLGEGVEVEEDLIAGLFAVDVVGGQVEVVEGDGTLGALIHGWLLIICL